MSHRSTSIVILGGGVGGLQCALRLAQKLRSPNVSITLVDKQSCHVLRSRLYSFLTSPTTHLTAIPFAAILNRRPITFKEDIVTAIDPIKQQINLYNHGKLAYDYLVVALGSIPNDQDIVGHTSHALHFNSVDDAIHLRQRLQYLSHNEGPSDILIGGGGSTGLELAFTIRELHTKDKGQTKKLRIHIIEKQGHLSSNLSRKAIDRLEQRVRQEEIDLYVGYSIRRVKNHSVELGDGRTVPFDLFIWTAGTIGNPLLGKSHFNVDEQGRVLVDKALRASGFSRVYVIGDSASVTYQSKKLPPLATYAIEQGKHVANNIARVLYDEAPVPYRPQQLLFLIVLGKRYGVLRYGPLMLYGRTVVLVKRFLEFGYLLSLAPLKTVFALMLGEWSGSRRELSTSRQSSK